MARRVHQDVSGFEAGVGGRRRPATPADSTAAGYPQATTAASARGTDASTSATSSPMAANGCTDLAMKQIAKAASTLAAGKMGNRLDDRINIR
jgi:hypothetical protein